MNYKFAINAIVNFDHTPTLNIKTLPFGHKSILVVRIKVICRLTQLDRTSNSIHTLHPALEDGTDRGFRNVGKPQSDAGEIPKRIHKRFKTRRKFEIKK